MLQVNNVTKIYGRKNGFKALDNVSINFGSRGLVVVLGKSGCGKSTLLNIIGGLDSATSGEVVINGRSTRTFKTVDFDSYRNTFVGIVFQEFNLIDEITVYDNINMTMKLQDKNADVNTVDEVLDMVGLSNLGYRKPSELSGGQRQRVALARALLKKPEILLADEPTGALDTVTGEGVFETLKRIAQDKLVIVVTHNRDLAFGYADRIIEISDGRIIGDSMKDADTDKSVKELEGNTIEVSAGGKLTKELLNRRLKKNVVNYIGLSGEKDRIALAYPETVEGFYDAPATASFEKTKTENIRTDDKPFKLSKGKMKFKDSIAYARKGIKRAKKRYRFLMVVTSICFTFFSLALMVALINAPSLVAKSAFDTGSQPLVIVGAMQSGNWRTRKLSQHDVSRAAEIMGEKYARGYKLNVYPELADTLQEEDYNSIFGMSSFNGVMEAEDVASVGLKTVAGKSKCESLSQIIISDFAAYTLCKRGYIGYGKDGKYSVLQPVDFESLVGTKMVMMETALPYEIVGVFETDYEKYRTAVVEMEGLYAKKTALFGANKAYLYRQIFAAAGFAEQYRENTVVSDVKSELSISLQSEYGEGGYWTQCSEHNIKYDKKYFEENMFWSAKKADGKYVAPDTLGENEIIVNKSVLSNFTQEQYEDVSDAEQSAAFAKVVNGSYYFMLYSYNGDDRLDVSGMKIVGVYDAQTFEDMYNTRNIMVSGEWLTDNLHPKGMCDAVYFNKGVSQSALNGKFSRLGKNGFTYGTAVTDFTSISVFTEMLEDLFFGFLIAAIVLFVLAFLTIFNYMSATVRFRTKEIAVFRVIGAKSSDIIRMFLAESAFIVLVSSVVSIALSALSSLLINDVLSGVLSVMGMAVSVVNFNWIINPLAIILGCALIVAVSALLPISRITSKKPVEAVKLI